MAPQIPSWVGRIWVAGTTCLIAFIAYSSQIFIIWPWYGGEISIDLIMLLGPFNVLVSFLFWNYYLCVVTEPGGVPKGWKPDLKSEDHYEIKRLTGGPRYCAHCEHYKPPRTHHCRQCKRCVLRMDHHCPWVNNCVGHFNYAHFLRFLFLVDVSCAYHLWMITSRVLDPTPGYWQNPSVSQMLIIVANYCACIPVLLAVGIFSMYHFYCLFTNTTTIEGWEKDKVSRLVQRGRIRKIEFPYDLGIVENVRTTLGPNPLLWCWPLRKESSSGLRFQVAEGRDSDEQHSWPPKDPQKSVAHKFRELPVSPWTYGDGPNPALVPTSGSLHKPKRTRTANVPPYHPDYRPPADASAEEDEEPSYQASSSPSIESSENEYPDWYEGGSQTEGGSRTNSSADLPSGGFHVRRGSEGYEVRPVNREHVFRRHLLDRGDDLSRYRRYVPESHSSEEGE